MNWFIFVMYNAVYWIPMILIIFDYIDYQTGFIAFALIVLIRTLFNLYRINALPFEQAVQFPFRAP